MIKIKKHFSLYVMMLPVLAYFLLFSYYPLIRGFVVSLQQFRLIGDRPFVGFANYAEVWHDPAFWGALWNTVIIGGGIVLLGFFMPLVLALSLNEVLHAWYKRTVQMIVYLPHLFSWVVVGGMWIFLLSPDQGLVNLILREVAGTGPFHFFADPAYGRWLMILSATWKEMGFTCILFLAAIVSIHPHLYEAARIDGASRFQQALYVTLPQLGHTMKVILLLETLSMLRIFDQIFIMKNPAIARKVDVIMVYTYETGILSFQMGIAAAASFIVIAATFVLTMIIRRLVRYDQY